MSIFSEFYQKISNFGKKFKFCQTFSDFTRNSSNKNVKLYEKLLILPDKKSDFTKKKSIFFFSKISVFYKNYYQILPKIVKYSQNSQICQEILNFIKKLALCQTFSDFAEKFRFTKNC